MDRITLAFTKHKGIRCAAQKAAQGKSQAGKPSDSRDKAQNTRHHRPAQTGSFGCSARSGLAPPTSLPHNRIECARQAKSLPRRITTDLTPSRPPQGRLRVSARRPRCAVTLTLCAATRTSCAAPRTLCAVTAPCRQAARALRASSAPCCGLAPARLSNRLAASPAWPRTPKPHGSPWGFVMARRLAAFRRSHSGLSRSRFSRSRFSALFPRAALSASVQQLAGSSTKLLPTLLRRCHA
jgi:hypothetical protein